MTGNFPFFMISMDCLSDFLLLFFTFKNFVEMPALLLVVMYIWESCRRQIWRQKVLYFRFKTNTFIIINSNSRQFVFFYICSLLASSKLSLLLDFFYFHPFITWWLFVFEDLFFFLTEHLFGLLNIKFMCERQ